MKHALVKQYLFVLNCCLRFLEQLESHFGTDEFISSSLHNHKGEIILTKFICSISHRLYELDQSSQSYPLLLMKRI